MLNHWLDDYDNAENPRFSLYIEHVVHIDIGEPGCFGCGSRPDFEGLATAKSLKEVWNAATCLELAHLHDYARKGGNDPGNFVLLCWWCHLVMPSFARREPAAQWVVDRYAACCRHTAAAVRMADNPDNIPSWARYFNDMFAENGFKRLLDRFEPEEVDLERILGEWADKAAGSLGLGDPIKFTWPKPEPAQAGDR